MRVERSSKKLGGSGRLPFMLLGTGQDANLQRTNEALKGRKVWIIERRRLARSCTFGHLECMNERIASILEQVYELTASERAELIDALTDVAGAEVLDPAYLKEIEDRLAAYDRGEVEGLDAYEITMRGPATK